MRYIDQIAKQDLSMISYICLRHQTANRFLFLFNLLRFCVVSMSDLSISRTVWTTSMLSARLP